MFNELLVGDTVRKRNRRLVLEQISTQRQVSRREMVDSTGLSKAAVSSIVAELMEMGLVQESGRETPSSGRPRVLLSFIPDARWLIGVELNDHNCRAVLTNLYAEPVRSVVRDVPPGDLSVESLVGVLETCVNELTAGIDSERILGLGVCVPGVVDPVTGTVVTSVIVPWHDVPLGTILSPRFSYPVVVFSRGSAATWGERWYGVGRATDALLYVRVGHGVVGGLVLNGQPYWGPHFAAGELGHITVQPDGDLCGCGNRGCLATVATLDALLARALQRLRSEPENDLWAAMNFRPERLTFNDLVTAADQANPVAVGLFADLAKWLAVAVSSAIHLLDLQMVVIGGPVAQAEDHLLAPLRRELAQRVMPAHYRHLRIVSSQLREEAPAVGAASLMLHDLLSAEPATSLGLGY